MRIYPITVAPQRAISTKQNFKNYRSNVVAQPSLAGWKAGVGATIGTGVGLVLGTVISGGLLAPFLAALCGMCATVVAGSSQK